ncbi:hypothetical protein L2E82_10387 [Cichorium intybus]|uniref:Uncharacterized protein n=1 Tax=Cichorium intybus TaxID=13427 RepID=A0ACB9GBF3_CICIN|nr:hypothetical protein L2E82_10387 [Cichorium intybus]
MVISSCTICRDIVSSEAEIDMKTNAVLDSNTRMGIYSMDVFLKMDSLAIGGKRQVAIGGEASTVIGVECSKVVF